MNSGTCACGMFAVGSCATCGQPRCGQHASHDAGGYFVCNDHIAETRQQAADAAATQRQRELEEARAAVARERELLRDALPGFPPGPTTSPGALASALRQLVPAYQREFGTGKKSFGRRASTQGWAFDVGAGPQRLRGQERLYLVVTIDGHAYVHGRVAPGPPTDLLFAIDQPRSQIDEKQLRKVTEQVLDWTGRRPSSVPTPHQRYLVEFDGAAMRPRFDVWVRDNS